MKTVSRFEANLLHILRGCLRHAPPEEFRPLVENGFEGGRPPCLSRAAVELVQDALARGCPALLAGAPSGRRPSTLQGDGWRRERFLRGDRPVEGRLWERTPPAQLGLAFSGRTLDFLMWLTAVQPAGADTAWEPSGPEWTLGDLLLLFFAYEALRGTKAHAALCRSGPFRRHSLCRLAFPEDFGLATGGPPDFVPWTTGTGACIVEVFQRALAARWVEVERGKENIGAWQTMRRLGESQEQTLTALLEALEAACRPDLARFLLQAAAELLPEGVTARAWVGGLQAGAQRLADRVETNRAALALVRQLDRLRRWERAARSEGYFDEGYARSQLWLADWERHDGDALHARAQALVRELDPLRQAGQ
jgi:hypothetical protein